MIRRAASNSLAVVFPRGSGAEVRAASDMLLSSPDPAAAALGDLDGIGAPEAVVWSVSADSPGAALDVYSLSPDDGMVHLAGVAVDDKNEGFGTTRILIGNVDPAVAGPEVVVAQANHARRRVRVRIFGGLAEGNFRRLHSWRLFHQSDTGSEAVEFAVADALLEHSGSEVLVSSPAGKVYIFGIDDGRRRRLQVLRPFRDRQGASAARFAVADLIPDQPGLEIAFGDDGTVGDGFVRVLDPARGAILAEARLFDAGEAPAGVSLSAGDIVASSPGAELVAGQGEAGGRLRVFNLAARASKHLVDVPNPAGRGTSSRDRLVIADLLPSLPGSEIALAQADSSLPVQVFSFDGRVATLRSSVSVGATGEVMSLLAAD